MNSERKVQGAQWYITLDKDWRKGHGIEKGDVMDAIFEPDSVMILNPQSRELSTLEGKLINVLINLPRFVDTQELIVSLREIVDDLDTA